MAFLSNLFPQRYTDALCMLAAYKDVGELIYFFDSDMNIDAHHSEIGQSALVFASINGKVKNVEFLLRKGASEVFEASLGAKKVRDDYSSGRLKSMNISTEKKINELDKVIEVLKDYLHRSLPDPFE